MEMMGGTPYIDGMRIIESNHLPKFEMKQYRFPKSKSLRIKKKYRKDTSNFRQVPINPSYIIGNTIVVSPEMAQQLRKEFR